MADLLTMSGLEVEGIEVTGASLADIVVARTTEVRPHPDADRLSLCRADMGDRTVQVVCGAPNMQEGALVPLALPGITLPNGMKIEESTIRGQLSTGMLCAEDELGLTEDHTGIMILPADCEPGTPLSSVLPFPDWVFEVGITPNRPDWTSILGVAREIAALTGRTLRRPDISLEETGPDIDGLAAVVVDDPDGCPRYSAGLIRNVTLAPSPFWMRYRLHASGIRSINNLVDVSNYVLMELGQPLHAFDYARLQEHRIVVRRAGEGERFTTLDGESRCMSDETLMICDGKRAVALAGIMGGLNSEIFAGTTDVLVESAYFDPVTIRRASKKLGLSTEASYRFERGIDIEGTTTALRRSLHLLHRLAGGTIARGCIDVYPRPYAPRVLDLRVGRTNRILGTDLGAATVCGHLKALEMEVIEEGDDVLRVTPPSFRVDITREIDLVEEVARVDGYENIPVTFPNIRPSDEGAPGELGLRDHARTAMVGLGFSEAINYSFTSPDTADFLGAGTGSPLRSFVTILNPLTVEQSVMRTSLLPGLLASAHTNMVYGEKTLKLFEWGKVFFRREGDDLPAEKLSLAGLMTGPYREQTWYGDERAVDFYDAKGTVEALLEGLGVDRVSFRTASGIPGYDDEVAAGVYGNGDLLGYVGRVIPGAIEAYELKQSAVFVFELSVEALSAHVREVRRFRPYPKYPAVYRDLSLIVGRAVECSSITGIIAREGGDVVESVGVFDVYEGDRMDPAEKSMAFRVCYRSERGTLDGTEVNRLHQSIIDTICSETGGKLKEG